MSVVDTQSTNRTLVTECGATGDLQVIRHGSRSVVSRAFARSPLRLLNPSNHGHAAWIFSSTYGGGLVGGDAVSLKIHVGRGATALLQTQASTKIYRSAQGVSSSLDATVEDGGLLAILPDPVVCFAGSTYRQQQAIDLQGTAHLILMDWITCGRRASGERWAFDSYTSRITIRCDSRLLLFDALRLHSQDGPLAERMGRFDCVCLVALAGPALRSHAQRAVEQISALPVSKRADILMAASPLGEEGCLLRIAGVAAERVGCAARDFLSFVPALLGDDPWARKW